MDINIETKVKSAIWITGLSGMGGASLVNFAAPLEKILGHPGDFARPLAKNFSRQKSAKFD